MVELRFRIPLSDVWRRDPLRPALTFCNICMWNLKKSTLAWDYVLGTMGTHIKIILPWVQSLDAGRWTLGPGPQAIPLGPRRWMCDD